MQSLIERLESALTEPNCTITTNGKSWTAIEPDDVREAIAALKSVPSERMLADWVDRFVEHEAENCNGFQSAVRFRAAIMEAFGPIPEDSHERA